MEQKSILKTGLERDPGPGRTRVGRGQARGYVVASPRTWKRIQIEYSNGASAAWLSSRYGPAERTIATRAKAGGWRKTDVALRADAAWDAEEAAAGVAAEAGTARMAAAVSGEDGGVDWVKAGRRAQAWAIEALERGDAKAAQEFLKLARMLDGVVEDVALEARSPEDEAALAAILERLGAKG